MLHAILITAVLGGIFLICSLTPFIKPLEDADLAILKALNPNCKCKFADSFMVATTHLGKNALFWALMITWLWVNIGFKRSFQALIALVLIILLTDFLAGKVAKNLWDRPRPTNAEVRQIERVSKSASFPSAHAANWFAAAKTLSRFVPRSRAPLFTIASLIAYSRIYLGVHYPSDVLAGCIMGYAISSFIFWLCGLTLAKQHKGASR